MDKSNLESLALLVVKVLHIGERKADRMAIELCSSFGVDLEAKLAEPGGYDPNKVERIRAEVVAELTDRCPNSEALMVAFARSGAVVIAMVEEIYRLLSDHSVTTNGTSADHRFRLVADDLDLTLSDAFFEDLRRLRHSIMRIELGAFDTKQLRLFVGLDNGESFGLFPTEGGGRPLLYEIQVLRPIKTRIETRAVTDGRWAVVLDAHARATASAERLLDRLEEILGAWAAAILSDGSDLRDAAFGASSDDWIQRAGVIERANLIEEGVIGMPVPTRQFTKLAAKGPATTFVGVQVFDSHREPVVPPVPTTAAKLADRFGSIPSTLGCYIGLWRGGFDLVEERWAAGAGSRATPAEVVCGPDPGAAIAWLDAVSASADEAVAWIDGGLWIPNGYSSTGIDSSVAERFLKLPLWEDRSKLFEIWTLCRTIRATEAAGWSTELTGLVRDEWILPAAKAQDPVARIRRVGMVLDVWREPDRGVTPDVTIATPAPWSRDLVVVEVKDRNKMHSGFGHDGTIDEDTDTAAGRALSYVRTLGAALTWVCNHCPGKGVLPEPDANIGTPWHRVHLADDVAPRSVPPAFDATIAATLCGGLARSEARQLVLVLDTTQSMRAFARKVEKVVRDVPSTWYDTFTALLVGDHNERYVVYEVDPMPSADALWAAIDAAGTTHGGDVPEALEDAMQIAHSMARSGVTFVVVTDAPPHTPESCPQYLDFAEEVAGTLHDGAEILVVTDRLGASRSVWEPFVFHPGFTFVELDKVVESLNPSR